MEYFLSIDIGTTSIKIGIFGTDGQLREIATQEYAFSTPSSDRIELAVDVYWSACKKGIDRVLKKSGIKSEAMDKKQRINLLLLYPYPFLPLRI